MTERVRWWSPDEAHLALHPANRNNEFPSPFSHSVHHDIQLAIKHALVIQWLMSLVAVVKGLGLSLRLGTGWASLFVFLSWQHLLLSSSLCLFMLTHKQTHTYCTHKHTHAFLLSVLLLITGLCYREDWEAHLQFSNLYDSALFNQKSAFLLCTETHRYTHMHTQTSIKTHGIPLLGEAVKVTHLIYYGCCFICCRWKLLIFMVGLH